MASRGARLTAAGAALAVVLVGIAQPDRVPGTPAPAYVACAEEDGSTPGQVFPCAWDATTQGNGQGESYLLAEPATCDYASTPELAAAAGCPDAYQP